MDPQYWLALYVAFVLSTQPPVSSASNILGLFPHHGYSHFKVFYPVLRGLAERGHKVTVVTHIKSSDPAHPNYEELLLTGKQTVNIVPLDEFTPTRSLDVIINEYFNLHAEGQDSCEHFYESGQVERVLEKHKRLPYDLVVMEFFNTDCYMGVPYLLQVPVVGLSSCSLMPWYYDRILVPDTPSHVQTEFVGFPEVLNWQQRLINFIQAHFNKLMYRYYTNYQDSKVIKKYLHIDLDVYEYAKTSTNLIFVNQHYTMLGNRPRTPQLIEIGGIHIDERRISDPLPVEISEFLQNSPEGVLFISWGSMLRASTLEPTKLKRILKALEKFPLKIIWKWESDDKPTKSEKFLFVKWAPQLSLLCHPKVKLFWGHAGLLGTTETIYCGKPSLLTPMYGDQFLNANAMVTRKTGVIMYFNDIDEVRLTKALQEAMRPSYAKNSLELSKIFRNRITSPFNTTMWWIEHLLRHKKTATETLQTKAVHLNWFVYYSLDSVALLLAALFAITLLLRRLIQIARLVRKRHSKIKTN